MKKIIFLILVGIIFTGCNLNFQNKNPKAISCDDPDAISLAEDIINNQVFNDEIEKNATSKFKIDTSNIVWWDTKKVGRNLCQVKISAKVYKTNDFDNLFVNFLKEYNSYGVHYNEKKKELSGWIYFQTYPIMNSKDGTFYVQILHQNEVRDW